MILNVLKSNEFSKLFKTVLIIEEDNISIEQNCLIKSHTLENVPLRNYLIGSEGDFKIINYLESRRFEKFENYILTDESNELFIKQGIKIYSKDHLEKVFNIKSKDLSDKEVEKLRDKFYEKFTSKLKTEKFCFPYVKTKNISKFIINDSDIELYLPKDISNLERPRTEDILLENRILISRTSDKFKAVFIKENSDRIYPTAHINTIKLSNSDYYFYTAILNSKIIEYYLKVKFWQRINAGFPRVNQDSILQIPIPLNKNIEIVEKITELSKQLTNKDVKFEEKEQELNSLIYNLYGIGIIEKQRINDFFIKDKEPVKTKELENYANEFCEYFSDFLNSETKIVTDVFNEENLVKGISIVKIYFGNKGLEYPKSQKVGRALLFELLKYTDQASILSLKKRLYGENSIYIIKDNLKKSWSLTKANEDAIDELNKIFKHKSKKN